MNLKYEPKKIFDVSKSQSMFKRALSAIPAGIYGHLGPSEGCMIPVESYPLFMSKAQGSYIWDIDGNRFVDYMCAYGPNYLGYNDPDVDAAAAAQRKKGDCCTLISECTVQFAEEMIKTINMADWAFFAKNGGDVTAFSAMIARAYTHRKKMVLVKGFYHGVAPWMQKLGYAGVTEEDLSNNLYIDWNAPEQLEALCKKYPGQIAGLIATPYFHPTFEDNILPPEGYWPKMRKICDDNGIVLIFDDVRAGLRIDEKGSDYHYGIKADLSCFCKAIANGYNTSAICGVEKLKNATSDIAYTGSYWLSSVPHAAGVATLQKARATNATAENAKKGIKLTDGLKEVARDNGFDLRVTGEPGMFYMRLGNDLPSTILHQEWVAECVKRGVFFTSHHNHFINAALTDADFQFTWEVADEAYKIVKAAHPEANYSK
ncbi:MAG: aminotransferase class III-fold pyridoxal phosphate-dependent enzyme [Clostridia bacterium]